MVTKNFIISVIAVAVSIFAFEFIVHGKLLAGMYEETAHLWRPKEQCSEYFHYVVISYIGFSTMFVYIFGKNFEGGGLNEGLRYGLIIGLLLGSLQIATQAWLPIPLGITLAWIAGEIGKCIVAGAVLSKVYKK